MLQRDIFAGITEEGGRFRSFLLTALKLFLINEWARAQTQKRGDGRHVVSLDGQDTESRYQSEPADHLSPDVLFQRRWITTLLERVMGRLQAEYRRRRKAELFDRLQVILAGADRTIPYRELGTQLGLSEGAVKVAVHRFGIAMASCCAMRSLGPWPCPRKSKTKSGI